MRACKAADLVAKFGGFEILFLVAVWAMNWMGGMKRAEGRGALTVFSEAETLFFFFPPPAVSFQFLCMCILLSCLLHRIAATFTRSQWIVQCLLCI